MQARIFNLDAGKLSESNAQLARTLGFLLKFNAFAVPLYAMLVFDVQFVFLQTAVRDATFYVLNLFGLNPSLSGYLISIPIENGSWAALINWDCTGWKSLLAFFALIMATDRGSKAKWKGLAIFLPLIFIVNIARIIFMFYFVRAYDLAYFSAVHTFVWSWGLIFAVLFFWVLWMRKSG